MTSETPTGSFRVTLAVYATAAVLLFPFFRFNLTPDSISYIGLAQKIACGDFRHAVNGHWSPLVSCLLTPLLATGLAPFVAFRLLMLALGAALLFVGRRLARTFELSPAVETATLGVLAVIALSYGLLWCTPDLLITVLLLSYLAIVFDRGYAERRYAGARAGAMAALAYLSKSYALPFFAAHFVLISLYHFVTQPRGPARRRVLVHGAAGLAAFAALSGPWIAALSAKQGNLTVGTAGRYNTSLVSPAGRWIQPMAYLGFLDPPNDTAVSIWEDPSAMPAKPWSPLATAADRRHLLRLIAGNLRMSLRIATKWSVLSVPILLAFVVLALRPLRNRAASPFPIVPLATVLLYLAGYLPLLIESRYVWLNNVLILFMGAYLLDRLPRPHRLAPILLAATFLVAPLANTAVDVNKGRELRDVADALAARGLGGRIASHNDWLNSLYLCYYVNAKYYGLPPPDADDTVIEKELRRVGVEHYLVWGTNEPPAFLARYERWSGGPAAGPAVYSLK